MPLVASCFEVMERLRSWGAPSLFCFHFLHLLRVALFVVWPYVAFPIVSSLSVFNVPVFPLVGCCNFCDRLLPPVLRFCFSFPVFRQCLLVVVPFFRFLLPVVEFAGLVSCSLFARFSVPYSTFPCPLCFSTLSFTRFNILTCCFRLGWSFPLCHACCFFLNRVLDVLILSFDLCCRSPSFSVPSISVLLRCGHLGFSHRRVARAEHIQCSVRDTLSW